MTGSNAMTITKGEQVAIGVRLEDETGESITASDVSEVVIFIGEDVTHRMTDEENPVTYDDSEELWVFSILQAESFALDMGVHQLAARVKFTDGSIGSADVAAVFVLPSDNAEEL